MLVELPHWWNGHKWYLVQTIFYEFVIFQYQHIWEHRDGFDLAMRRGADIRTRSKKTAMLVFINVNKESSSDVNKTHEYEEDDALRRRLVKGEEKTSCMRPDEVVTACVQPSNHPLYHTMTTSTSNTTSTACATLRYLSRSVVAYQLFVRPFGPVKYPL